MRKYTSVYLSMLLAIWAQNLWAFESVDPYDVSSTIKKPTDFGKNKKEEYLESGAGLAELADYALKNNPQTQVAWLNTLSKAQNVGISKSAYLPSINAGGSIESSKQSGQDGYQKTANGSISLSYVLYDFGAREANLESAKKIMDAAIASENAQIQSLFLSLIQSYFSFFGARESLRAYEEAERTAKGSYEAAVAKYRAGVATPADKLQAMTAYSQAILNRQKAEGTLKNAYGALMNTLGLEPGAKINIAAPNINIAQKEELESIEKLMEEAKKIRPDLVALKAQVDAAKAAIESAKASGQPTLSLSSSLRYYDSGFGVASNTASAGVSLNIPLFTGFSTTYRVASAQIDAKSKEIEYEKAAKQVALEVYTAYNNLSTQAIALQSSKDMLLSAEESLKAASGRYKAGAGSILELLSAQSAYASARQQNIEAAYGWYMAKAALLQSIGRLVFEEIEKIGNGK